MSSCGTPQATILRTVFRSASVGSYMGRPRGIPFIYMREIINLASRGSGIEHLLLDCVLRSQAPAFLDVLECSTERRERGLFAGQVLPADDDHVHVFRIELQTEADALRQFRRDERG